jgi:hypothetical protein
MMSSGGIFENKGAAQHYSNYLSKGRNRKKNPPAMNVGGPTSQVLRSGAAVLIRGSCSISGAD